MPGAPLLPPPAAAPGEGWAEGGPVALPWPSLASPVPPPALPPYEGRTDRQPNRDMGLVLMRARMGLSLKVLTTPLRYQ